MEYPYVSVSAYDVTNLDARASVEIHFGGEFGLTGVTEQDVVDAVKDVFAQLPNVSVTARRFEVTSATV
ncbi:hypothetical protein ACIQSP_16360 [Streptomyces nigra]|uniref:hypothetical protein n=1 Tax=Streptomyces nigra TaxID=1827580 RepID=UPI00381D57D9